MTIQTHSPLFLKGLYCFVMKCGQHWFRNAMLPMRYQAITRSNNMTLSLQTHFNDFLIEKIYFHSRKWISKTSYAKCQPCFSVSMCLLVGDQLDLCWLWRMTFEYWVQKQPWDHWWCWCKTTAISQQNIFYQNVCTKCLHFDLNFPSGSIDQHWFS